MNSDSKDTFSDEISLKDLILKIHEFWFEILRSWKTIILILLLAWLFIFYKNYTKERSYIATLSYMLHQSDASGGGSLSSLMGSFGLGQTGDFNAEKLIKLSESQNILHKVLLDSVSLNKKEDLFANHIIELYDLHGTTWEESDLGKNKFKFTSNDVERFDRKTNSALKTLYGKLLGNKNEEAIYKSQYDESTGIFEIMVIGINEQLSIKLAEHIFHQLDSFYIQKTIEGELLNYNVIQARTDSLKRELHNTEMRLARYTDSSNNLIRNEDKIKSQQLSRQVTLMYAGLAKAMESLEMADFALKYKTPYLQIIDKPFSPLNRRRFNILKTTIMGLFLGLFISIGFIVIRKIYRDALK